MALQDGGGTRSGGSGDFAIERAALSSDLKALVISRGKPSLRTIAGHSGGAIGYTTVRKVLQGEGMPSQEHLLIVVRVLLSLDHDGRLTDKPVRSNDPVLQPWRIRWQTLTHLQDLRPTVPRVPAPATEHHHAPTAPAAEPPPADGVSSGSPAGPVGESAEKVRPAPGLLASPAAAQSPRGTARYNTRLTSLTWQIDPGIDPASAVAFSPDGTLLATAGADGTVRLWNPATHQTVGQLTGHTGWVYAVAFSPDGTLLATAGADGTVRLWNPATHQTVRRLTGHTGSVFAVAFSPDGTLLATAGADGTVRLRNPATHQTVGRLTGHTGSVFAVAFSPDGTLLATAGDDGTARLWNPTTCEALGEPLTGHTGRVLGAAFSPDGTLLATAGADGSVRLWGAATCEALGEPLTGHTGRVLGAAFSPDGTLLATAGADGTVRLWGAAKAAPEVPMPRTPTSAEQALRAELDGCRAVPLKTLQTKPGTAMAVAFSADGTHLAVAGSGGPLSWWNSVTGAPVRSLPLAGHTDSTGALAFSPDGTLLATGSNDTRMVRLWDLDTGRRIDRAFSGHAEGTSAMAFSPDGTLLATAGGDGAVRLWSWATGQLAGQLSGHAGGVSAMAFSPNGTLLATSKDGTVRLWSPDNRASDSEVLTGHPGGVSAMAFSPDGTLLATASTEGLVRLRNPDTSLLGGWPPIKIIRVCAVAFSPDSTLLAAVSREGMVRRWALFREGWAWPQG